MRDKIPLFPLTHGVFPDGMLSLQIFEVRYLDLIRRCHEQQLPFGVVWLKKGSEIQVPGEKPLLHSHGCSVKIENFEQIQPNLFFVSCRGGIRFELIDSEPGSFGVWQGEISYLPIDPELELPDSFQHYANRLGEAIATAQKLEQSHRLPIFRPYFLDQCGWVANRYAEVMDISTELKLQLLCELDPLKRMQMIESIIKNE